MILHHYTKKPLGEIEAKRVQPVDHKPVGLWLSDDSGHGWRAWCESEMPNWIAGTRRYAVEVDPTRLLLVQGADALDALHAEFGSAPAHKLFAVVDWQRVAERYDGVVITPYLWSRRLDRRASWYYSWDCASGCIWHPSAILSISEEADEPTVAG